jgi:hypothetical protein
MARDREVENEGDNPPTGLLRSQLFLLYGLKFSLELLL